VKNKLFSFLFSQNCLFEKKFCLIVVSRAGLSKAKKMEDSELLVTLENCSKLVGKRVILILAKEEEMIGASLQEIKTNQKLKMAEDAKSEEKVDETKPTTSKLEKIWS
jgi:hypothetical protein